MLCSVARLARVHGSSTPGFALDVFCGTYKIRLFGWSVGGRVVSGRVRGIRVVRGRLGRRVAIRCWPLARAFCVSLVRISAGCGRVGVLWC